MLKLRCCFISSLVLLLGLSVTAILCWKVKQDDVDHIRAAFEFSADSTTSIIRHRFDDYAMVMRGLKGFFEGSEHITYPEFQAYVRALELNKKAGIQGIGLVKIVPDADKNQHIADTRRAGFPDYQIKPEGQRERYAPIMLMEPSTGDNSKAIGFDVLTAPTAVVAMEQSRDLNQMVITSRLALVQDNDKPGVFGFVLYLPLYQHHAPLETLADRRAAIAGWADVPFRMPDLMAGLREVLDPDLTLEIHDGEPQAENSLMYRSSGTPSAGSMQTSRQLDIGGRQWTVLMQTTPAFVARVSNSHRLLIVALAGITLTSTLSWLAWLLARGREEAQMRYQKLFEQAGDGVLIFSADQRLIDANPAALRMLGYSYKELPHLSLPDILARHEHPRLQAGIDTMMAGMPQIAEWRHMRKDGSEFTAEMNARNLNDSLYFAIVRDLTERKKAEQRIQRLTQLYKALSEVNQAIVRMHDEIDLFPLICRCAVDFGGIKMAWLGQLDTATGHLVPAATYGEGIQFLEGLTISANVDIPEGRGPAGTALRENRAVIINDCLASFMTRHWHDRALQVGWRSTAAFPIQRNGKPFAVLNVYHAEIDAFDEESIQLLHEMASDIGFALDNFDRENQRQQAEKALAESEARMSTILANVGAYIFLKDGAGRYLYANQQVLDLWHTTLEQVIGRSDEEFFDAQSAAQIRENDRLVLVDGKTIERKETDLVSSTGKLATYWTVKLPLRHQDGSIYALCGISTDITQLKHLEQSLSVKRHMLAESQRIAHIGSWRIDIATGHIEWSDETYRIYQVAPDSFDHTLESFMHLVHPEDRPLMRAWTQRCRNGEEPAALEFRILLPDGGVRILEGQGLLKYDAHRQASIMEGTVQDITERVQAEQQLRLTSKVFEYSQEGIVITDANNAIISANPAYVKISGYPLAEALGKNPRLISSGQHDKSFYQSIWQDIHANNFWQGEVINRRKTGELYPQWLSISVIRDQQGQITHHIGILSDLTEHKSAKERIQFLSNFNPLTQLPNKALLRDRTQLALATARREHEQLVLMYLDIDRFNIINDSLGPRIGDKLLQEFANRLVKHLHSDDTLSHHGSDEFNLLLLNTDAKGAAHVAQKLLLLITQPFNIENHLLNLTASIGIAEFPQDGDTFEQLLQSADAALFRAKQKGRNNFQFFTSQLHERATQVLQIENELRHGLERGELLLHYQPKVNSETLEIIGAEALIRWQHPQKGLMPPGLFIPIAEESDLIVEIGDWVLQRAARQLVDWQAAGLKIVPVAVNLSVKQFRQDTLYQMVAKVLRQYKLEPALLELELTEGIAMENTEGTIKILERLHQLGVKLSIDDFGTGYSSLSYLRRFKIDKLKIDQSFVRNLEQLSLNWIHTQHA